MSRRSRPRVLVVDDDADIRKSLQRGLDLAGFDVEIAADSRRADAGADDYVVKPFVKIVVMTTTA